MSPAHRVLQLKENNTLPGNLQNKYAVEFMQQQNWLIALMVNWPTGLRNAVNIHRSSSINNHGKVFLC